MIILVAWIGVMGLVAAGAGWVLLSRFPEVFFNSEDWRATKKGRVSRAVIIGLFVLFALAVLASVGALVISGIKAD